MPWWKSWSKKYVILCCICGGTAILLGVVFIVIYFTLHYYTSSLQYFETIPTYAPAVVLIITGLLVMCFARRRNRYAYLIKLAGGCCLMCALLCVIITVTTTVVHMNRLQTLRECVYTQKTKTCTCFAGIGDDEGAARYVFNNTPDCEVVHGSLYTCLRAMFGLSVIGILVCIFSSMLVYQLLSHEKKKMYWEQLEMRRRFFYCRPTHPLYCNCYDDYGFAAPHDVYHWQPWEGNSDRCWPSRSIAPRLGFGNEDCGGSQRSILVGSTGHRASGWNWLPWNCSRQQQQQQQTTAAAAAAGSHSASTAAGQVLGSVQCNNSAAVDRTAAGVQESPMHYQVFPPHPGCWTIDSGGRSFPWRSNGRRRRRRSNDAVFHHLNMTPPTRYQPPFVTDTSFAPSISYAAYSSLSHHLWDPPPPYSRQMSAESVSCGGVNGYQGGQRVRMIPGSGVVGGGGPLPSSPALPLAAAEACAGRQAATSVAVVAAHHHHHLQATMQSKQLHVQKPPGELVTDVIIGARDEGSFSSEYESISKRRLLLPFCASKMNNSFTLPTLHSRGKPASAEFIICSKSTPHIPQTSATPVGTCGSCHLRRTSAVDQSLWTGAGRLPASSPACDNSLQSIFTETVLSTSERSTSTESYDAANDEIDDDVPSDFRTSMVVSTTPSSPVNDGYYHDDADVLFARSLPNLNLTVECGGDANGNVLESRLVAADGRCAGVNQGSVLRLVTEDEETVIAAAGVPQQFGGAADTPTELEPPVDNSRQQHSFTAMSDSTPAMPVSVPTLFQTDDPDAKYDALRNLLLGGDSGAGYRDTSSACAKSKSLGNLFLKDSIIVTFKSVNV